ncbi:unnamed protein product, partial [Closterium sp. NIES-65]
MPSSGPLQPRTELHQPVLRFGEPSHGNWCSRLPSPSPFIHPCSTRPISSLTPHPSIPPSARRADMPAALSAWVCLSLNVTAACHLLLLPPRGSLPPAAHSRALNAGQSDAGYEGDPRVDLSGGFCAAGLSVADAVRWPCSSQHRRRATAAVQSSAGGMAERCGGAMDGGGGVDPRPCFLLYHPLPFACAVHPFSPSRPLAHSASPPLRLSASPPLCLSAFLPLRPSASLPLRLSATPPLCHSANLPHPHQSVPLRPQPTTCPHSRASPLSPTTLSRLPSLVFPHSSVSDSPFAPPPPNSRLQGELVALGASWGAAEGGRRKGKGGRVGKQKQRVGGEQGGRGSRAQEEQGGREDGSKADGGVVWAEGTCAQLFLLEGVV